MNTLTKALLVTLALAFSQNSLAQEWTTLFDGSDLDNFYSLGEAEWNVIEDYVEADGYTGSFLVTNDAYGDFELELEFWPSEGANSGVYVRNSDPQKIAAQAGYEINIFDTNENPDNRTGSIVFFSAPLEEVTSDGKWNKYEIRAEGNRITVRLDGVLVADLEDDTYASGPIALQNNGGLIRFRNVRIREIGSD